MLQPHIPLPRATALAIVCIAITSSAAYADVFDRYTNAVLAQALEGDQLRPLQSVTPEQLNAAPHLIPGSNSTLLIVKTQNGFNCKLLAQFAQQKLGDQVFPVLVIERFATYRPGTERSVVAEGRNVLLFPGFTLHLEIGQIVPANAPGDLRLVTDPKKGEILESPGTARIYLVTKHLPGTEPKKTSRPAPDENYRLEFFNGTFRLYDDGRRSGILRLQVDAEGNLSGHFFSDATGNKYPVSGKVGQHPRHVVQFSIKFPQSVQYFHGYIFTKGGQVICGSSKFQEHEAGFYAVRTQED